MKAAILTADQFDEAELLVPYYRMLEGRNRATSARCRASNGYPLAATRAASECSRAEAS